MLVVFMAEKLCDDMEDNFGQYTDRKIYARTDGEFALGLTFDRTFDASAATKIVSFAAERVEYWNRQLARMLLDHARRLGLSDIVSALVANPLLGEDFGTGNVRHDRGLAICYEWDDVGHAQADWPTVCKLLQERKATTLEAEYDAYLISAGPMLRVILIFGNDFPEDLQNRFYKHNNPKMHGLVESCSVESSSHLFKDGTIAAEQHY
jgi:hypothetical protein